MCKGDSESVSRHDGRIPAGGSVLNQSLNTLQRVAGPGLQGAEGWGGPVAERVRGTVDHSMPPPSQIPTFHAETEGRLGHRTDVSDAGG